MPNLTFSTGPASAKADVKNPRNRPGATMPHAAPLDALRSRIRDHYLAPEDVIIPDLITMTGLDQATRDAAQSRAADFVRTARANAERSGLIDKFLQEYGLSTAEGVDAETLRASRVFLVACAKKVIAEALDLLGIEALEQM